VGVSYDNLLNEPPARVIAGDRANSLLYQKVTGSMADELTPVEAELIGQWIDQGANPSGGGTCTDNDGDGYGSPGDASCPNGAAEDCNDADPAVNPGATENCTDGVDNDCDGQTDGADSECGGLTYDYATDIQAIFTANCALESCHSTINGTKPKKGMNLEEPASQSWDNLVPTGRVVPGDRNASLLYEKITIGSMVDELTPAEAEMIGVWIDEGANP
jgi:hypothetical protein